MLRLPVSGADITLRAPDGNDEMLLREASSGPIEIGLTLLERLASPGGRDWAALTVTDFEVLLLALRALWMGPALSLGFACPACQARVEVSFAIADYLAGVTPRACSGVAADPARPGWFRLDEAGFRLPTAGDQAAVARHPHPARRLAALCFDEAARRRGMRPRIERAMAAMAPDVSRPIAGDCPECGAAVEAPLHVARIVVGELRRAASAVHDDVDAIARAYHWPEAAILALPQHRRRAYAERIRRARPHAA